MKIGIFTDTYLPAIDGVVTSISTVKNALEAEGEDVAIIAPSQTLAYEASPRERVWRLPSLRFYGDPRHRMVLPWVSYKSFEHILFDVIHTQTPAFVGMLGVRFARAKNLPVIHTYHTRYQEYAHYLGLPKAILEMLIAPAMRLVVFFLNKHDAIIAPSEGMRRELLAFGVQKPITVIPTGIDIKKAVALADAQDPALLLNKFNLKKKDELVIFASRLGKEKNVEFLIRAMGIVMRTRPQVRFLIVGDGNEKENLEKMVREAGLASQVIFTGFMGHEDLFALYRAAKLFVFASHTETQGLVTLEAMALGVPVVALRAIGIEDLLEGGRGGALLENEDINAFSRAVLELLEKPVLRRKKSKEAQARAKEFSIERTTEMLIRLYQKVLAAKKIEKV